jgi:hypothetical protein
MLVVAEDSAITSILSYLEEKDAYRGAVTGASEQFFTSVWRDVD